MKPSLTRTVTELDRVVFGVRLVGLIHERDEEAWAMVELQPSPRALMRPGDTRRFAKILAEFSQELDRKLVQRYEAKQLRDMRRGTGQ